VDSMDITEDSNDVRRSTRRCVLTLTSTVTITIERCFSAYRLRYLEYISDFVGFRRRAADTTVRDGSQDSIDMTDSARSLGENLKGKTCASQSHSCRIRRATGETRTS
jgi:hypothetical protein